LILKPDPLDVLLLWIVLYVVVLPIGGPQHPQQGPHEVHQVVFPLKSCSKRDFTDKLAAIYLLILHLSTQFNQNCFSGLGVKGFFHPKKLLNVNFSPKKTLQKKF
jgi:hypothetical protein